MDVQVNVSNPGTFDIKSDTVNGFSFRKAGSVVFGLNTIRPYAAGKPIAAGTSTFTIKYGSSTCTFDITVLPPGSSASLYHWWCTQCLHRCHCRRYICSRRGAGIQQYINHTSERNANRVLHHWHCTVNGFAFAGSGVFTATGLQNVVNRHGYSNKFRSYNVVCYQPYGCLYLYSITVQP